MLQSEWRIGVLGAGFIVRDCQLVAYKQAGLQPVAIASRQRANAEDVARQHDIATVFDSYETLINDPTIDVLDIAVPPHAQPDLIRLACEQGQGRLRGILAQKPLAMSVAEARELVEACANAGIALQVNQNMRHDQSVRALKQLLDNGTLGEVVFASIDMRAVPHWMPWAEEMESLSTFIMSIHHLDTFRYWLGTPDRVLASTRPDPRTQFKHVDGINLYILEYDSGARAAAWDDVWAGPCREGAGSDIGIRWRVEGTEGLAVGTIGWPGYPERVPSTIDYTTKSNPEWVRPRWAEAWFPDAFAGPMLELLQAIETGSEPAISGRDNLETLALCEAIYAAATQHRVTTVAEYLSVAATR